MLQYLSEGTGDTGELDISSCEQTIRRSDASDIPSPERERAGIFPTGSPFLISSNLSWEDRPKLAAGASGAAALLTCCALHPFDLIKTRMQGNKDTREEIKPNIIVQAPRELMWTTVTKACVC